jgi:hypothetical protein
MTGAQSIMTGAVRAGGATVKTGPGLTRLKGWSRGTSRLIPTAGYLVATVIPTLLAHLWAVKGWRASPTLVLPNAMPADLREPPDREDEQSTAG